MPPQRPSPPPGIRTGDGEALVIAGRSIKGHKFSLVLLLTEHVFYRGLFLNLYACCAACSILLEAGKCVCVILPSALFPWKRQFLHPAKIFPVKANTKLATGLLTVVVSSSVKWIITPKCVGLCIRILAS